MPARPDSRIDSPRKGVRVAFMSDPLARVTSATSSAVTKSGALRIHRILDAAIIELAREGMNEPASRTERFGMRVRKKSAGTGWRGWAYAYGRAPVGLLIRSSQADRSANLNPTHVTPGRKIKQSGTCA